ncbi:MAG: hypothetical protein J5I91_01930 [Bacteroidetes bacterium]|nr:hypothetical protein [Bacteroidota bacterium]
MNNLSHYILLANLFRYPESDFSNKIEQCRSVILDWYPEAYDDFKIFADYVANHSSDEQRELFTKTFDVQAICYLDLGYVIFGEDYKRGVFLVNMKHEQDLAGNDCGSDLPDNLCNILTFFTKTNDAGLVDELAVKILIPGVNKMLEEFEPYRMDIKLKILKNRHYAIIQEELYSGNVYKHALLVLLKVLQKDFEHVLFKAAHDLAVDEQYHKSFFNKSSVNVEVNRVFEKNNSINNYKQD